MTYYLYWLKLRFWRPEIDYRGTGIYSRDVENTPLNPLKFS